MPLRRMIRSFTAPVDARTAATLTRQLADFEDNVSIECDDIRATTLQALKPTALGVRATGTMLSPGASAGFETADGDLVVLLATPEARLAGKFAVAWKRSAANNLIFRVAGGASINGAAFLSRSSVGLQLLFCDGVEYWA